ncbi:MAG: hypothetical protein AUK47_20695 [Deltaproteobacteria bacterium CG2_30_63_29]|nr:MAG: hypothetical protein AUK47_20695 [Deltaproteobacteria bacterium CG2_30_63_29]PJB36299.1 MAG: hypothetical protein CO108_23700 [Deltaproteobacteria bacterium CG_4_9_14_3_um_filter_63_12]
MRQPYLDRVVLGKKTIESRFSRNRQSPYGVVRAGDLILLKESSGPILAVATVQRSEFHALASEADTRVLIHRHRDALCLDGAFIELKASSRFASLFFLGEVVEAGPLSVIKTDRRSWVRLTGKNAVPSL